MTFAFLQGARCPYSPIVAAGYAAMPSHEPRSFRSVDDAGLQLLVSVQMKFEGPSHLLLPLVAY